jgi:hypothetical protein
MKSDGWGAGEDRKSPFGKRFPIARFLLLVSHKMKQTNTVLLNMKLFILQVIL